VSLNNSPSLSLLELMQDNQKDDNEYVILSSSPGHLTFTRKDGTGDPILFFIQRTTVEEAALGQHSDLMDFLLSKGYLTHVTD
jgi:hypothetical protein